MLYNNLGINSQGHLTVGGLDTCSLAAEYGTPLYVMDEDMIRANAAAYVKTLAENAPAGSMPFFASKSCSFKEIYRIIGSEGMGTDLVSPGEIYTALSAGFDMKKSVFHGNNKTDADIRYGIDSGVGFYAADTFEEIEALDRISAEKHVVSDVLLRVTPGIDAHTFKAVTTGNVDSKFGFPLIPCDGDAASAVRLTHSKKNLRLRGFHFHIGSQITELSPFCKAADIMLEFIKNNHPDCDILNIGGGFGIAYKEGGGSLPIAENVRLVCLHIREASERIGIKPPMIFIEPGRSVVAAAGLTLYTVGSVKIIPEIKNYVSIDGGMPDNPRFALYGSEYTCVSAGRMNDARDFVCTLAGRCCESGDIIQENVPLPHPVRGDIIAVLGTGAYNFSMSSNYNRLCRPAVVMISGGNARIAVRRETFEHLTALEL